MLERFACGEMGMTMEQFYELTPRGFQNCSLGYMDKYNRQTQLQWEQTRFLAFWSTKTTKTSVKSPNQLLCFPWEDKQPPSAQPISEQLKRNQSFWEQYDKR